MTHILDLFVCFSVITFHLLLFWPYFLQSEDQRICTLLWQIWLWDYDRGQPDLRLHILIYKLSDPSYLEGRGRRIMSEANLKQK
jgi:hypothetical protein